MSDTSRRRGSRGGQGGHEPRARIRTRELRAMALTALGWSQPKIAADLGISQAAVCKLLKRIETRLFRELSETVQRQSARQALRLDHLYAEAIRGWNESKADTTRRRQRKTQGGKGDGATVAELVVENEHGDPRYLDVALKALADLRKLLGLDAPQKVDVRASRNPYADMTEDDLRAELTRQARLLGVGDRSTADTTASSSVQSLTISQEPDYADRH